MAALRRPVAWAWLLLLVLIVGGGAFVALRPSEVTVVKPRRGAVVQTVVSSGRVMPPAEIKLGTLTASTVREVFVKEGEAVRADQLLVQLDDGEARAAVERAEAGVTSARAGRSEIARLSKPAAAAALRQAEATLAQARRNLSRSEELYTGGVLPPATLEEARTAKALAESQHAAAQLQVKAASTGGSQSMVAAAAVAQAQASLAVAKEQLARMQLRSPVDGVVLARYLEPGDAVVAGSTLLLLSREGATRLVIEPDERNLATLAVGQAATASAEAFPAERFAAELQYIAPSVDPQRGTVEVRLAVAEPPAILRPHMTVSVEVVVGEQKDALTVPRAAVRDFAGRPHVLVVEDGTVRRRDVTLGIRGDLQVEVTEGLEASTTVVADEASAVVAGDRVRAVER